MTPVNLADCEDRNETLRWAVWWLRTYQPHNRWCDRHDKWHEILFKAPELADELEAMMTRAGIEVVCQ